MRTFLEWGFAGTNSTVLLRHAYGQFLGRLFGRTRSTLSDPEATHEDLDAGEKAEDGETGRDAARPPAIEAAYSTLMSRAMV